MRYAVLILWIYCLDMRATVAPGDFFKDNYLIQAQLAKGLVFDILQDSKGLMWFGTEFGLLLYDGRQLKTFKHQPLDSTSLSDNVVTTLAEDELGNLWVGTMFGGLNYLDRRYNTFERYIHDPENACTISGNRVNDVVITAEKMVYITVEGGGLNLFNPASACFKHFRKPQLQTDFVEAMLLEDNGDLLIAHYLGVDIHPTGSSTFSPLSFFAGQSAPIVKTLARDGQKNLWLGTREHGLFYYSSLNKKTWPVKEFCLSQNHFKRHLWQVYPADHGQVWIATDEGLYVLESGKESWPISRLDLGEARRALVIFKSRDGVFWVGTNNGVLVLSPRLKKFNLHTVKLPKVTEGTIRGVTCINPAKDGQLWVGTTDGLYKYQTNTQVFNQDYIREYPAMKFLSAENNIMTVHELTHGQIWVSTIKGFNSGFSVYKFDLNTNTMTDQTQHCEKFRRHVTYQITADHQGHLWFANGLGLIKYLPELDSFRVYVHDPQDSTSIGSNFITRVFFSSKKELWIGTNDAGLDIYNFDQDNFRHLPAKINHPAYLSHSRVIHITEDQSQRLIVATAGGLNIMDAERGHIRQFLSKDGLIDDHLNGVISTGEQLWLTSPQVLTSFDQRKNRFVHYEQQDGLHYHEFWDRTAQLDSHGRIYFGTDQGLLEFHPDEINVNAFVPPIVFTELLLFNQVITPHAQNSLLPEEITRQPKIIFKHWQNVFSVHFRAMSYIRPDKTQYMARLEGFEEAWQDLGTRDEITYTNLNPGKYTLQVKAKNNDGIWNETGSSLHLEVLTPWWRSSVALFSYALTIVLLAYGFYHIQIKKHFIQLEHQRLVELDGFKSKFFTNITHEFRTPLTLILGLMDQALKKSKSLSIQDFQVVKNQAGKLLLLINDILDISKIEAGKLTMHEKDFDLINYLKYLTESFYSSAKEKKIAVNFMTSMDRLIVHADEHRIASVYTNILSNALKFTPPGGEVTVDITCVQEQLVIPQTVKMVHIAITDNGPGIDAHKLPFIFDRYYSTDTGNTESTGLGLALAKELTALMGGQLLIQSIPHKKTTFTIQLPLKISAEQVINKAWINSAEERSPSRGLSKPIPEASQESPLVLIVEDNEDVKNFIYDVLASEYRIIKAENGEDGLIKAMETIPDIILSDVMMQNLNGYELLTKLKLEEKTSHIPVILITAKADVKSKLIGLKLHADAYLPKPFDIEELILTMDNLLLAQRHLKEKYLQMAKSNVWDDPIKYPEHIFLRKVRTICAQELNNPAFSIEDLCRALGISHAQAHRKMVALTGHSLQIFFKLLRLEKAKELLTRSDLTISEIAYATGFEDPSYFTKVFKKESGESPTAWRKK